jgi:hypothetical protein
MTPQKNGLCTECKTCTHQNEYNPFDNMDIEELKLIVSQSMYLASLNDARLTILMDWLRSYSALNMSDGKLEYELAKAKEEAVHKVGDYLQEIMSMDSEVVFRESIMIKLK